MTQRRVAWSLLATAALVAPVVIATTATGSSKVSVRLGTGPDTTVMPNDRFTVADTHQLTGRRVALPFPSCSSANSSICDGTRLLNTLDGFDLQPRVSIPFTGAIDVSSITPSTVFVSGAGQHVGLQQLTYDPSSHLLLGTVRDQLHEQTRYTLTITGKVRDASGHPIAHGAAVSFTTMSATSELDRMRRALDDGSAYRQAKVTSKAPSFTQGQVTTVFPAAQALLMQRRDQVSSSPKAPLVSSRILSDSIPGTACIAYGSFESPQFVTREGVIPSVKTSVTPKALSKARIGFALIVPAGVAPAGGWPVAVYGPGFTRSYFDIFLTSDANASAGIATLSINPLGHGYGPGSKIAVEGPGGETTFLSYGRGHDLDGDGQITSSEGVGPTDHKTFFRGKIRTDTPSPYALVGDRDGLQQTAMDNMAAVRMIEAGVTVPSCQAGQPVQLAKTNVAYYGLSFGSIYGTMLFGTDPHVRRGFLNVGGGPIIDIARLGGFRNLLADQLRVSKPSLLNGGPGLNGFTEDIPQPFDGPITKPHKGAVALQQFLADANWYERGGSPESFAPLIRLRPRYAPKTEVLFQTAFGDDTVPNTTAGNMYRAGQLFDRVTYYRNDLTPTNGSNPHGFLEDPTLAGRENGELQLTTFLKTGVAIDPDGPSPVFEFPIADPDNLQCLHFGGQPSEGKAGFPPAASGSCGHRPAD